MGINSNNVLKGKFANNALPGQITGITGPKRRQRRSVYV